MRESRLSSVLHTIISSAEDNRKCLTHLNSVDILLEKVSFYMDRFSLDTVSISPGVCHYGAGFTLSELTSGLPQSFQSYEGGSLLTVFTAVISAECLTCSRAGYVRDKRPNVNKHSATDQSDQSVLLENDITIHQRCCGAQSTDHDRVSEEAKSFHRPTNLFKCI